MTEGELVWAEQSAVPNGAKVLDRARTLYVNFAANRVDSGWAISGDSIGLIGDQPPSDGGVRVELSNFVRSVPTREGITLLRRLNSLTAQDGGRYSDVVEEQGVRPWWFHQQIVFDQFLVPFLRYQPLLQRFASAERIVVSGCPDELKMILPLVPLPPIHLRVERAGAVGATLRRGGATLYFGAVTALALCLWLARRPSLLVYGIDAVDRSGRNPWLGGLFDALRTVGRSFQEIVWSPGGAQSLRRLIRRRSPPIHLRAITGPAPRLHPTEGIASVEASLEGGFLQNLAERVILPRARWSLRAIGRLERLLVLLRPRGVLAMDDAVHGFELLAACRRRGVPTVAVQHGQIDPARVGLMGYGYQGAPLFADRYCVWSDHFEKMLTRASALISPDSIVVTGTPRPLGWGQRPADRRQTEVDESGHQPPHRKIGSGGGSLSGESHPVRVLFIGEQYDPITLRREVAPYVSALWQSFPCVRIRPHPSQPETHSLLDALAAGGWEGADASSADPRTSSGSKLGLAVGTLEDELREADVVVGSFSSVLFEAVAFLKPVALFATSRYADPHGLAAAGIALLATHPRELASTVERALTLEEDELLRRQELLWGGSRQHGGAAALDVLDALIGAR